MKRTNEGISVERTRDVALLRGMKGGCLELRKIRLLVDHKMKIGVMPKLKDQLLKGAVSYWEGAARINLGKEAGGKGKGYLEVTGLTKSRSLGLCANQSLNNYRQIQSN